MDVGKTSSRFIIALIMYFCSSFISNCIFKSFTTFKMTPFASIFKSNIDREGLLWVVWKSCDTKMVADLVRFVLALFDVWKWRKSMECDGVFAVYIERKEIFIHLFSDFSVNPRIVRLWMTIGLRLQFQRTWRHWCQEQQKKTTDRKTVCCWKKNCYA